MSFIENFWEENGDIKLSFINLSGNKEELTAKEAYQKLSELDKKELEFNSNEEYLRNSIEGRINYMVGNYSIKYFDTYKGIKIKVRYSKQEGSDMYSIFCFANEAIWSCQTDNLDKQYNIFKKKIDAGKIQ